MVYDRIGHGARDRISTRPAPFGLSTALASPFGVNDETDPDVRFTGIDVCRRRCPSAPPGGFPQTPPIRRRHDHAASTDTSKTPYAHIVQPGRRARARARLLASKPAYVGRRGRNLLVRRDLAMPLDLKDPASGTDYFTAAQAADHTRRRAAGIAAAPIRRAYAGLPAIPYWENMFPDAARTALLGHPAHGADVQQRTRPDSSRRSTTSTSSAIPACSKLGPFAFFTPQYDSLGVQSTIGRSDYDALQLTLRKRFSAGYQFDLNYTLAHAKDHGLAARGRQRVPAVRQRRLHRLPDQLVGTGPAVRQRPTSTSGTC